MSELTIEQMKAELLEKFPKLYSKYSDDNDCDDWWLFSERFGDQIGWGVTEADAIRDAYHKHCASPKASEPHAKASEPRRIANVMIPLKAKASEGEREKCANCGKTRSVHGTATNLCPPSYWCTPHQPTAQPDAERVSDAWLRKLADSNGYEREEAYYGATPIEFTLMARELLQLRSISHLSAEDAEDAERYRQLCTASWIPRRVRGLDRISWPLVEAIPEDICKDYRERFNKSLDIYLERNGYAFVEADRKAGPR